MAKLQKQVPHPLDQDAARQVAREAADHYVQRFAKYHPSVEWHGPDRASFSFSAKGVSLKGEVTLQPGIIGVQMDVPLLLKPLAGKATAVVEAKVREWVERGPSSS